MPDAAAALVVVQAKPWMCPEGHHLGLAMKIGRIWRLVLYDLSFDPGGQEPEGIRVIRAEIRGAAVVRCTICNKTREWFPDAEAMEDLLRARERWAHRRAPAGPDTQETQDWTPVRDPRDLPH